MVLFSRRYKRDAILNAVAATMLLAACIHLIVAFVSTIITHKIDYINPIDFLGLSLLAPQLLHSKLAALLGWMFLVGVGILILYLHAHLRVSITIRKKGKRSHFVLPATGHMLQKAREYASEE